MTIPTQVVIFARSLDGLMGTLPTLHENLIAQSDEASGPEAIGYAALATELEQLQKVYKNYMPRIYKHVGDLAFFEDDVPADLLDLVRENEPYGDARERLWSVFVSIQHKLADDGKTMPKATSEEVLLYTRLYPHMGWMAKPGAVEVI
jgi:hypothetical protein